MSYFKDQLKLFTLILLQHGGLRMIPLTLDQNFFQYFVAYLGFKIHKKLARLILWDPLISNHSTDAYNYKPFRRVSRSLL